MQFHSRDHQFSHESAIRSAQSSSQYYNRNAAIHSQASAGGVMN